MSSKPPHRKKRPTEFKKSFGRGDPTSLQTGQAAGREALRNDLDWDRDSSGAEKSSFSSRGILIFGGIGLLLLLGVCAWALFFSQTPDDQDQSESLSAGPAAGEIEIPNDTLFDLSPMLVARNFTNNPEPAERHEMGAESTRNCRANLRIPRTGTKRDSNFDRKIESHYREGPHLPILRGQLREW